MRPFQGSLQSNNRLLQVLVFFCSLVALTAIGSFLLASPPTAFAQGPIVTMWTQVGPNAAMLAKVITTDANCPQLTLDGKATDMQVRAQASPPDFPNMICEAPIPAETKAASINGEALPLFKPNPQKIVVMGDGGCRIEGDHTQACNDPNAWPLAKVAASAAADKPDLVIHVGDYIYREDACPAGNAGCAGSPHGDNWDTMNADFFTPIEPLLRAAPIVLVRGNHEDCDRGGPSYFRYLDPRPVPASCPDYTDPYPVPMGTDQLLVMDTSFADDYNVKPEQVAAYKAQFDALYKMASSADWLVSHKPIWAFGQAGVKDGKETLFTTQPVLQAASDNKLPPSVQFVLSGHLHIFDMFAFVPEAARPPQVIMGNAGTTLDAAATTPLAGMELGGAKVESATIIAQWGYTLLEIGKHGWAAGSLDVNGGLMATCNLQGGVKSCAVLLPSTGGDLSGNLLFGLIALGAAILLVGILLLMRSRRGSY